MAIEILHDEQSHRRLFEGFLREYEMEGLSGNEPHSDNNTRSV
jgi:hypothetical protein